MNEVEPQKPAGHIIVDCSSSCFHWSEKLYSKTGMVAIHRCDKLIKGKALSHLTWSISQHPLGGRYTERLWTGYQSSTDQQLALTWKAAGLKDKTLMNEWIINSEPLLRVNMLVLIVTLKLSINKIIHKVLFFIWQFEKQMVSLNKTFYKSFPSTF